MAIKYRLPDVPMSIYNPPIRPWLAIADHYQDSLIVANGGSVAVHRGFSYRSLYYAARETGHLDRSVTEVFAAFGTEDFELVLRRLWHATLVNRALNLPEGPVESAYRNVRNALIRTIIDVHVSYEVALPHLTQIYRFLQRFDTVVSLNYDLIVYWAAMLGNQYLGNWFKDTFLHGTFDGDWKRFRANHWADGYTLIFYPHGNLVLAQANNDSEVKVAAGSDMDLLNTIFDCWSRADFVPLFVCEGTSEHKSHAIRASHYLNTVYTGPMHELGDTVVIYGWSMSEQDAHILEALAGDARDRIAVSVYNRDRDFIDRAMHLLIPLARHVDFFDSASEGCWNNPELPARTRR